MLAYRDGRYWKDGRPYFVVGVEYQYYRDLRENWAARLRQLREARCNVVTFYVPWRHHMVRPGEYDFTGRTKPARDLATFLRLCEEAGFDTIAKPGPFVHSELNIGGLPDAASPSFNPAIQPVLRHDGSPLRWSYDDTLLPSPEDAVFDAMAREWLEAAGAVLRPHAAPRGRLIGIQLNDETLYCTSNEAPWNFGYEIRKGPQRPTPDRPVREEDLPRLIEWGEFQWRVRRDAYARYKRWLGIEALPHLTNYAGITPPIEENVPGKEGRHAARDDFSRLYPEWWLAQNRIEADLDICEYGIISWLGVAAYDEAVFQRYINTARRRRGINMEENWGFATLYDARSKHPLVPFFQTLVSVAGGCTGYVVFTGVSHAHWDADLDGVTKRQHPWFPSDAPIRPDGTTTPMYDTMRMLNEWFDREGSDYLRAESPADLNFLVYPDDAAVSSWVPDERYWGVAGRPIPRCGLEYEALAAALGPQGYVLDATSGPRSSRAAQIRAELGPPRVRHTPGMRAFVFSSGPDDHYVWFFGFAAGAGPHRHRVEFDGRAVDLDLGSRTAGVVHLRGDRIASALLKGRNEVEGVESEIAIRYGRDEVRHRGDLVAFFT